MTELDFKKETFRFPVERESGFKDGKMYGFKGIDRRTIFLKNCFQSSYKGKNLKDLHLLYTIVEALYWGKADYLTFDEVKKGIL